METPKIDEWPQKAKKKRFSSPIEWFFSWGNKFTEGNPIKKAQWDYYLLIVMFLAFFSILIDNARIFYDTLSLKALGWSFVMLAILWFQYFGLKQSHDVLKIIKENYKETTNSKEEMLKSFSEEKEIKEEMKGGETQK